MLIPVCAHASVYAVEVDEPETRQWFGTGEMRSVILTNEDAPSHLSNHSVTLGPAPTLEE